MQIKLKYGHASISFETDDFFQNYRVLTPNRCNTEADETEIIRETLHNPVDSLPLRDLLASGMKVAVITSDLTRPCPSARLLPHLLDELGQAGIQDEDVQVIFGLGTHRAHSEDEKIQLAGEEVYRRVRCIDSDPADVLHLGHTKRGTPLNVFRPVMEADVRICLGGIEYHYFAGYSGGYKAVLPGVCDEQTIQHNHRMMTETGAATGVLDGNPVRQDIDEGGAKIGVDFILNVILDESKRIVHAVSGRPLQAHRAGCRLLDESGRAYVPQAADIVIAAAGGYPKDVNMYQAQKALDNASQIVRPGGVIILVVECSEGMGSTIFEEWMQDEGGPDAIIERIRRNFVLGGHKAAAVAMTMKKAEVFLVSAMPQEQVKRCHFSPFENLEQAILSALQITGPQPFVVIMPQGGSVLPSVSDPCA